MNRKNSAKNWGVILIILIVALSFWFSSKPGNISIRQSDRLLLMVNLVNSDDIVNKTSEYYHWRFIIRKGAHFFIFLILGIALALVIEKEIIKVILVIILLAVFDEVHQTFTGRGARLSDVILDVAGGFTGWAIVESVRFFFKNNKKEGEG